MSLTTEQILRWRSTLAEGQDALTAYLASAEGQADPEVLLLAKVASGLEAGAKVLTVITNLRRVRDLQATATALAAEAQALQAELTA